MRYYFLSLALVTITLPSFAGTVVFLSGTGCSGKTSVCNELEQNDAWTVVSEDNIFGEQAVRHWKKKIPQKFRLVAQAIDEKNLFHAIERDQILFKYHASEDERMAAQQAVATIQEYLNNQTKSEQEKRYAILRQHITQTIINLAYTHHVIVETCCLLKPEHIEQIFRKHDIIYAATYCPFSDIITRNIKRNADTLIRGKNISNLRHFYFTLNSFTDLYYFSDIQHGAIDSLDKYTVIHMLDIVELYLHDSPDAISAPKTFTSRELSLHELGTYRKRLLGIFRSDTVNIIPKSKVDLLLRTDQHTPAECAKTIIDFVNSKKYD